ncbi:MAG: ATP-binding protein [Acidobacteriota bacterium]|nr:ATP-binding protein [Acidobacteriota bacterium]
MPQTTSNDPLDPPVPIDWRQVALDHQTEAVIVIDTNGRITYLNRAAEALAGKDAETARNRPLDEILPLLRSDSRRPYTAASLLAEGCAGASRQRVLFMALDGTAHPLDCTCGQVAGSRGPQGAVLVLADAREQAHTERELERHAEELATADRRKDQFLAMMAHELRNPLAPIRNAVELMRQVDPPDTSWSASRDMVERQVKHLARLVDDLLDVSRITRGNIRLRKEEVDLAVGVLRAVDAARPLIAARGHELVLDLPSRPLLVEVDPTRLEQVVANLLDNAAKYTMPGGRIWLTLEAAGGEAVLSIRDTGVGVPPDVLDRVFEPFVQSDGSLDRSEGGLGLGLTLVRSLVEMHGGNVEAHSSGLGQGSEFIVRLPLSTIAAAESPAEPEEPVATAPRRTHVLVVEDNLDAAESLASLLRLWNHEVSVAHDGPAALEVARAERPEVVLLDIGLPGLDGYQVARRLREEIGLSSALLVAMTGYGQPEDRRRSRDAGIQYHFVKPVEPMVLRSLLAGHPPADSGLDSGS